MENNYSETQATTLILDQTAQEALKDSAKWSLFLAIMGFIGIAFMILAGILMSLTLNSVPEGFGSNAGLGMMKGYLAIFYIIFAAVYFPPVYYLYQYSKDMKNGLSLQNSVTVSDALVALKSHHKFLGISIIVLISLYLLLIVGVIAAFALR